MHTQHGSIIEKRGRIISKFFSLRTFQYWGEESKVCGGVNELPKVIFSGSGKGIPGERVV